MLENLIYALPELILICGLLVLPVLNLFKIHHRKILKICTVFILVSAFMDIIFYNKAFAPHYLNDNTFNTMMNMIVYISSLSVLILIRRWYISNDESPFIFCEALLMTILFANIMTSSVHFIMTALAYWGMLFANYLLLTHSHKIKEIGAGIKYYTRPALLFAGLMLLTAIVLYFENGHLSYSSLSAFFALKADTAAIFYLMLAVFICFSFLFGFAPFNFWRTEMAGQITLPVLSYFLLVPFAAYFGALINFNLHLFAAVSANMSYLYTIFALVSIIVGALGTCSGKNMQKIFAYACLFHIGVMLLILSTLSTKSINNLLIYLFAYLIAMYGILSAFFGLKSKGEYLLMLPDIAGASSKKPYISAMITVYLFSLIGFPPFLGFVGLYATGYDLALTNHLYVLLFLLVTLAIIAYGYMQIIKNLYFEKSKNNFDTTERGIYALMLLNAILLAFISAKPDILIERIKTITENIFD